ncbi:MAG: polysaccharide lyase family 8 super-sandwich domain-containing protein, partial [Paludibacteraceae bacterium]
MSLQDRTNKKMAKWYMIPIIALLFFAALPIRLKAQVYDYEQLIQRVSTSKRTGLASDAAIASWINAQNSNGSWSDLNYGSLTSATGTSTTDNHLLRVWNIAALCTKTGHTRYDDPVYKNAVKMGLDYWYKSATTDPNWWFNWIYFPQKMGETLMFMREFDGFISKTTVGGSIDEPEIISLFKPTTIADLTSHGPGANEIDMALHYVYRGILTENSALLENTRTKVQSNIADNIQPDMVYHEHGPQVHIASYGWVLGNGITQLAYFVSGTPAQFDIRNENFEKVIKFIRETQIATIRGKQWDFSVMGRAISRKNSLQANLNYTKMIKETIDPENAQINQDALDRISGLQPVDYQIKEFNKQYWNSDYMQHARKKYLFSVRNVSTRTVEAETGNGENLKAYYLSNGATYISVDGTEYLNIMPYWDWSMIPGTTVPYLTNLPNRNNWGTTRGKTTFVGGASDGTYGASTVDQNKEGLFAKKSWFFFDDEIVCLGAGIYDYSDRNVRTTIDQRIMQTTSYIFENGATNEEMKSVSSSVYTGNNLKYIRNGKTAYYFPENQSVNYTMKSQSGSWYEVNSTLSQDAVSGYVFSLWIDHGSKPFNSGYSYIVVPGIETAQQAKAYDMSQIEIISNTKLLQAVTNKKLNVHEVVFHQPGSVTINDVAIKVSAPCVLLIQNDSLFSIADPTQSLSSITLTLTKGNSETTEDIQLGTSAETKGSTVSFVAKLPSATALYDLSESNSKSVRARIVQGNLLIESDNPAQVNVQIFNTAGQITYDDLFS